MTYSTSIHANKRMGQRGFRKPDLSLIMKHGVTLEDGYILSAKRANNHATALRMEAAQLDKLHNKRVIIRDGLIITVLKATRKQVKKLIGDRDV